MTNSSLSIFEAAENPTVKINQLCDELSSSINRISDEIHLRFQANRAANDHCFISSDTREDNIDEAIFGLLNFNELKDYSDVTTGDGYNTNRITDIFNFCSLMDSNQAGDTLLASSLYAPSSELMESGESGNEFGPSGDAHEW
ncbi:hypothetical protein RF11_13875 [Thelohanellus kitauei]|uniref:Uncharacterized protein n=1 Tax=Thelohanellus kitauei TaxID=669202 RepID=A0A0C2IP26_THEKT|nr:hypothetical protein RF11_13875 [Thelohanellus kitauei]